MSEEEKNEMRRKNTESQRKRREKMRLKRMWEKEQNLSLGSVSDTSLDVKKETGLEECKDEIFIGFNEIKSEPLEELNIQDLCSNEDPLTTEAEKK